MDIDDYQSQAKKFAIFPERYNVMYPALGLASEAGEVCGKIAKIMRDKNGQISPEDKVQIAKEIGDVQWNLVLLAEGLELMSSDILQGNLDKLNSRLQRGVLGGSGDDR